MAGGAVQFPVPAEVAYDYLVDPTHRPEWQSSLRAVELDPPRGHGRSDGHAGLVAREGLRWTDVTRPGLRPRMELTLPTDRVSRPRKRTNSSGSRPSAKPTSRLARISFS